MKCINCKHTIETGDVNVGKDMVFCRNCRSTFSLSEDYMEGQGPGFNVTDPPAGAWLKVSPEEIRLGAEIRSAHSYIIAPMLIGGILFYFTVFQNHGSPFQEIPIFRIHFLIWSTFLLIWSIFLLAGKVEITLTKEKGRIFTGVGKLGWYKNFQIRDINKIQEVPSAGRKSFWGDNRVLKITGRYATTFAGMLTTSRRFYLYRALKQSIFYIKTEGKLPIYNTFN